MYILLVWLQIHSLEVEYDGECEGDDECDDGGHDHEVDGRARRVHLVPRDVAPRSLRQRLSCELVRQVVHLQTKEEREYRRGVQSEEIEHDPEMDKSADWAGSGCMAVFPISWSRLIFSPGT